METQSEEPSRMARYDYEELHGSIRLVGRGVAASSGRCSFDRLYLEHG